MDLINSIKINSVGEAEQILKAAGTEGDLFEKAYKVGDEKAYRGVTYYVAGFNAKGVPLWRKKKEGGGGGGGTMTSTPKSSTSGSGKTWDKLDAFNKKGSDENKLWNEWYKYQTTGDPNRISNFRNILENKFPNVASWSQTSPNTGKAIVTAKDKDGNAIAKIDLSGDTVDLPKLQEFMDKCYEGKVKSLDAKSKKTSATSKPKNQKEEAVANLTKIFNDNSVSLKISDYITGTRRKSGLWVVVDTAPMNTRERKEFERIRGQLDGGKYRFEPNGVYEYWIQKKV